MTQLTEDTARTKQEELRKYLASLESVLVCYSGGLDSAFLLAVAGQVLGTRAVGFTATGPGLSAREREQASALAERLGVRVEWVDAGEMGVEGYLANGPDRCFHCKTAMYETAKRLARELGIASIANGTNTDDLGDIRPGLDAARQAGIKSPLLECGLSKAEIRSLAKEIGLTLWDKPASACLASRIPYGMSITRERLAQIEQFEAALTDLGLTRVRVRHHETIARIEVDQEQIAEIAKSPLRQAVLEAGKSAGFAYVALDLGGYRTGSHNEVLVGRHLRTIK